MTATSRPRRRWPSSTFCLQSSSSSSDASRHEFRQRLGLDEQFDRWRFLQKLLDLETSVDETNQVLLYVLQNYYYDDTNDNRDNNNNDEDDSNRRLGAPERTRERLEQVGAVLDQASDKDRLEALQPSHDFCRTQLHDALEELLPNPDDPSQEDDAKGLWDTVAELHGREAVRIDQETGDPEWVARCLVARVLLYYDFLQRGF